MPSHILPSAGIWSSLSFAPSASAAHAAPPPLSSPSPPMLTHSSPPSDWSNRLNRLHKELATLQASEEAQRRHQRREKEANWELQRILQTAMEQTKLNFVHYPLQPMTSIETVDALLPLSRTGSPNSSSGQVRDSPFVYVPVRPASPLGSARSFYVAPTTLTERELTMLQACDWSMAPERAYQPEVTTNRSQRALYPRQSVSSSSNEPESLSDPFTSIGDTSSSSDSRRPPNRPLFSRSRQESQSNQQSARNNNPSTTPSRYLDVRRRDLPLQNPFQTTESPLSDRSHMSSLLGLTPMVNNTTNRSVRPSSLTSFGMPSFAISDTDQSLAHHTNASFRSPSDTLNFTSSSHPRPSSAPRLSASKAQHYADVARVRTQLIADHRLHSIPSGSSSSSGSGSGSAGSGSGSISNSSTSGLASGETEFTTSSTSGGEFYQQTTARDISSYTHASSLLSMTHLSDT